MTNSSSEFIFVIIFLYLKNQDKFEKDKTNADTENDALEDGEEFVFIYNDEDLPPPTPTTEPPTPNSDLLNGNKNLSVDVSQSDNLDNSSLMVSTTSSENQNQQNVHVSINRQIEMPPAFHFPEDEAPPSDLISGAEYPMLPRDVTDNAALFPMVNQIYKESQNLTFEEKEQIFSRSPEESDMQSKIKCDPKKQVNCLNQKLNATIVGCRSKSEMHEESLLKVSMLERSIMGLKQCIDDL